MMDCGIVQAGMVLRSHALNKLAIRLQSLMQHKALQPYNPEILTVTGLSEYKFCMYDTCG